MAKIITNVVETVDFDAGNSHNPSKRSAWAMIEEIHAFLEPKSDKNQWKLGDTLIPGIIRLKKTYSKENG